MAGAQPKYVASWFALRPSTPLLGGGDGAAGQVGLGRRVRGRSRGSDVRVVPQRDLPQQEPDDRSAICCLRFAELRRAAIAFSRVLAERARQVARQPDDVQFDRPAARSRGARKPQILITSPFSE